MKRLFVLLATLAIAWSSPAFAVYYDMQRTEGNAGFKSTIYATLTTSDYLRAPARTFQRISVVIGDTFAFTVYQCATAEYSAGTCDAGTAVSASTPSLEIETGRPWLIFDVTAAETDPAVSYINIHSNPQNAGGGGGAGGAPAAEYAALSSIDETTVSHVTVIDCDDLTCASPGTGSTRVPFYHNGSAWVPFPGAAAGIASVSADSAPVLGNDLDADGYDIDNVGTIDVRGALLYSPDPWTGVIATGTDSGRNQMEVWQTGDGTKDTGVKSTVAASLRRMYALTEAENYTDLLRLYCGADSDCITSFMMGWGTGGSQTAGDEGIQGIRNGIYDFFGIVTGNLDTTVSSGAATTAINVSGVSANESRLMGENKLIVFPDATGAVDVDIVTLPPGVLDASEATTDSANWSSTPTAGQGVWEIGAGEVTSSGVGVGWCFKADLADYTGWDSATSESWLYITAVDSGDDTITTEWISQGVDLKTPYQYRGATGTDTGRVAPCGKLGIPTLNASYEVTATSITTGSGFPGVADSDTFEVHGYPGMSNMLGITSRVGKMHGGHGLASSAAFQGVNSMALGFGRYQINSLLDAYFSGSLSSLVDGTFHAFKYGLNCGTGDCETAVKYNYLNDDNRKWPFELDMGNTEFGTNDEAHVVFRVLDAGTANPSNTSLNLTVDKTNAWGQNDDPFLTANRTQTITGAKTVTGSFDFGGGVLEVPNSTTLPATCSVGQIYMDTDATSGQRIYACQSTNTWALQGDGGGGGSVAGSDTQVQFNDGGSFGGDAGFTYNKTTDALTIAGDLSVGGSISSAPSANPSVVLEDSNSPDDTDDDDDAAQLVANMTDVTGDSVDSELQIKVQIADTLTTVATFNGTGLDTGAYTIDAPAKVATSTGGALATNTITLATAAADYDLPDECDSATGAWATLMVRDVSETASLTVTDTGDTIVYKGLSLGANDELDSPGAARDSVTVVCMEANTWYVTANSGDWTDGGVAD